MRRSALRSRSVNCLNFGNPEHPEVMWQFSEVVEGMSEACAALGIPVIGGNVSFYNDVERRRHHPTPVVGVLGLIDELRDASAGRGSCTRATTSWCSGSFVPSSAGRSGPRSCTGSTAACRPKPISIARARCTISWRRWCDERSVNGVHDVSDGGLAVALAEMAITGDVGARIELTFDGCTPAEACFAEPASVVVCSVEPERSAAVCGQAAAAGVPARVIGTAGGDRLIAQDGFDIAVADATRAWRDAIPASDAV